MLQAKHLKIALALMARAEIKGADALEVADAMRALLTEHNRLITKPEDKLDDDSRTD